MLYFKELDWQILAFVSFVLKKTELFLSVIFSVKNIQNVENFFLIQWFIKKSEFEIKRYVAEWIRYQFPIVRALDQWVQIHLTFIFEVQSYK